MRGRLDGDISLQIDYFVIGNETGLQARFVLYISLWEGIHVYGIEYPAGATVSRFFLFMGMYLSRVHE